MSTTIQVKSSQPNAQCASCGAAITENYCAICGEKRFDSHDLTVKHFAEESFEGFTHFDTKFFRSVKVLVTRPGLLSFDFCSGKRVPYMRPFALFFVCNVLFFLLAGHSNVFSVPFSGYYNFSPYIELGSREIIDQMAAGNNKLVMLATAFNAKMGSDSKAFLAIFIPLLSLTGMVIRRKRLVSEHLIFSTHYMAFVLLYYTIITLLVTTPYYEWFGPGNFNRILDITVSSVSFLVLTSYYAIAAKRFYQTTTLMSIIAALLNGVLFVTFLFGYRILLFFKVIYSINV